jgi:hypothetical protein
MMMLTCCREGRSRQEEPMSTQIERFGDAGLAELEDAALREEVLAERSLLDHVVRGIAVAVPVSVVIWVGLIALAVGNKHPNWAVWLAMATGIGILSGVFFGAWAGFVTQTHRLEELDRHPEISGPLPGHTPRGRPGAPNTAAPAPDRQELRAKDLTHVVATWPGWLLELGDASEAVPISHVIRVPVLHGGTRWIVHTAEQPSRRVEYQHPDDPISLVRPP